MASLISSERVLSAGGITVNKLRNRLRGDVVDALQLLKYALRNDDQYFREQNPMITEETLEDAIALEEEVMEEVHVAKEWVLDIDCFLEDSAAVYSTFED
ncbi:hypothetical protein EDD85DRAFT_956310 [Armillaria nabsnona]|nr:hypothetical protein EDD85DRAFT_956310 [Armillaria nabsnona]